ncbi:HNH endonuclease [Paracoccus versutus]
MAAKALPPQDVLCQLLDYDPETGALTWKARGLDWFSDGAQTAKHNAAIWNGRNAGRPAFVTSLPSGHRYASIQKVKLLAHRVIWKMMTGHDPDVIDHINGDPADNRWSNLRSVRQKINARNCKLSKNNSSGVNGVYWSVQHQKWCARVHVDRRTKFIGLFESLEEAGAARREAEQQHGFHENHGRR